LFNTAKKFFCNTAVTGFKQQNFASVESIGPNEEEEQNLYYLPSA